MHLPRQQMAQSKVMTSRRKLRSSTFFLPRDSLHRKLLPRSIPLQPLEQNIGENICENHHQHRSFPPSSKTAASITPLLLPPQAELLTSASPTSTLASLIGSDRRKQSKDLEEQAWQSVWRTTDDGSYGSGGSAGLGGIDDQGYPHLLILLYLSSPPPLSYLPRLNSTDFIDWYPENDRLRELVNLLVAGSDRRKYHYNVVDVRLHGHIQKGNEDGLFINSVASCHALCALIMDAGTGFTHQDYIIEKCENNYYISAITGANNGSSLVQLTQVMVIQPVFPSRKLLR
uniref:DUF7477 domain-containing protein n=1 Tax=Lactuca sativa TaxID=4236 RepID=A0A9R1UYY0_LACSA|nr:hypothetical protein LSAT_V11C700359610 [Lactuca sativa]